MSTTKFQDAIGLPYPAALPGDLRAESRLIADQVLALFDECGPGLRRYVGSFQLGPAATEDVVQDVFLALFRHLSLGRADTNLKGWLFRVAHNLALKQRLRTSRRGLIESAWDEARADLVLDQAPNPEERLAGKQRQRRLAEELRHMPERDQQCLLLRSEGLRYRDIARTLDVSLGTVAKSIVRALTRLMAADME
jgi:RNA polymerase sigma-70 factor (ECF subfamily)